MPEGRKDCGDPRPECLSLPTSRVFSVTRQRDGLGQGWKGVSWIVPVTSKSIRRSRRTGTNIPEKTVSYSV